MNKVIMIGNLTKDPETFISKDEKTTIAKFTLAVRDTRDTALFIDCVGYNKTHDTIMKCLKKGNKVGVDGRLTTVQWVSKEGQPHKKFEMIINSIEFLTPKETDDERNKRIADEIDNKNTVDVPDFDIPF